MFSGTYGDSLEHTHDYEFDGQDSDENASVAPSHLERDPCPTQVRQLTPARQQKHHQTSTSYQHDWPHTVYQPSIVCGARAKHEHNKKVKKLIEEEEMENGR